MYSRSAVDVREEAYVDVRVCDLQIQYGNMPSGLDSSFHIDGLYIVLRCGDEVRRTNCLWPSTPLRTVSNEHLTDVLASAEEEEEDENDWVWNELFRFTLPAASQTTEAQSAAPTQGQRAAYRTDVEGVNGAAVTVAASSTPPHAPVMVAQSRDGLSDAVLPMSAAATAAAAGGGTAQSSFAYNQPTTSTTSPTPPLGGFSASAGKRSPGAQASHSPFLYPAIELELWRSTSNAENCLGRYTYHVPLELLHGGYGLQQPDAVAERVVPLRTKEASSIMGNLYGWSGHRLSLRLRVQAVGLTPATTDWTLPPEAMNTASAGVSGGYVLPYSLAMSDQSGRSSMYHAGYAATMGSLNPVLANLLAPFGVSMGQGQIGRPVLGVMGGLGGGVSAGLPPVFPLFATSSGSAAVLSSPADAPSVLPASGGQGVLGDGDLAWRGAVLPAVLSPYPAAPSQPQQTE